MVVCGFLVSFCEKKSITSFVSSSSVFSDTSFCCHSVGFWGAVDSEVMGFWGAVDSEVHAGFTAVSGETEDTFASCLGIILSSLNV